MSLLFIDGFDVKDLAKKWLISADFGSPGVTFTSSTRFGAGWAATLPDPSGSGTYIRATQTITASSQVFVGGAVKANVQSGQTYSAPFHILLGDAGVTSHLYLVVTNLGAVQLWRGDATAFFNTTGPYLPNGTMLAASANSVIDTNWRYIELGATINSSTGTAVVKVDNTQVISFTGNTKNGGTASTIDTVSFRSPLAHVSGNWYWLGCATVDDLYIVNSSGGVNNTFLGDTRIQTLLPTGAGSSTQFTPTSGANYATVNEVPDNTATYSGDSVSGHRDTYALADLVAATATVFAVQQTTVAMKSDAGAASLKAAQKSGATVSYGATRVLGTSPTLYLDVFETNPATSAAWTVSDVNGAEAGAEVV